MVLRTATQHRTSAQQPQQWRSTLAIKPTQPAGRAQPGPSAFASTAYQEPATPKKVRFVGNQVQLQMQGGDDFSVIDELTVDGDVVVQQFDAAIPNESTLELRGQKLRAISTADDLYRLIVSGGEPQPASVVSRGLSLTGPVIQLDQVANRLWVDGPGEMQMASTANRAPQESAGFAAGGQTHVQWRGGMVFDGQNVYFESNVKSNTRQESDETGTTTVTITESAALSLILNTRFDFRKSSNSVNQSTFDVTSMVMVGELETGEARFVESLANDGREELIAVTSQYDLAGKLISSRQIRAPRAEFDKRSGQANCAGPGSLTIRQLAKSGPAGLTAAPRSSAQPAANARISAVSRHHRAIDYVKIEFERSLRGNFEQNQLTFQGNVHAHYDGIDDWNDSPAGRRLSDSGMILDCDQLVLAQWTSSSETEPNVEMIATGDARAKGSQFEAVAERISYDQRADRVVVEAPTRGNAELWSQRRGQSKRDHLVAQKILYRLADGTFEVQKAKQIEYSQQEPVRKK